MVAAHISSGMEHSESDKVASSHVHSHKVIVVAVRGGQAAEEVDNVEGKIRDLV